MIQNEDFQEEMGNNHIATSAQTPMRDDAFVISDDEKIELIKKDVESNPPLNPDFQRVVTYYNSQIQYVTLSFDGSHLHHKKISISSKVIPISDPELSKKLKSKLELFDQKTKNEFYLYLRKEVTNHFNNKTKRAVLAKA